MWFKKKKKKTFLNTLEGYSELIKDGGLPVQGYHLLARPEKAATSANCQGTSLTKYTKSKPRIFQVLYLSSLKWMPCALGLMYEASANKIRSIYHQSESGFKRGVHGVK